MVPPQGRWNRWDAWDDGFVMTKIVNVAKFSCAMLIALSYGSPGTAGAAERCDTVPGQYMKLQNPVELTEAKLKYYRKQFEKRCARCHGKSGDGGGEDAEEQQYPPADFTNRQFIANCTDGQLFYQIVNGGEDKSAMPAFGPESDAGWSEEKIWFMVAFVRRFAT